MRTALIQRRYESVVDCVVRVRECLRLSCPLPLSISCTIDVDGERGMEAASDVSNGGVIEELERDG